MVTLYCKETPGLKLGPGNPARDYPNQADPPDLIRFQGGYADVSEDDPLLAEKMSWLNGPGCPPIRIVDGSVDAPTPFDPNDIACPETVPDVTNLSGSRHEIHGTAPCPARFKTQHEADVHQLTHRKK